MRYLSLLILIILPVWSWAQDAQVENSMAPQVTIETPEDDTTVGQAAIVRIKVLVPTFMPSPPVFPSLEQENLLVRLPERASGPISETVNGETWSGVQRSYRLYPLASGVFDFGPQEVLVTYADPETNEPKQVSVPLPATTLTATVPDAARGLDPLIIANGFELTQEIEGETDMNAGDAITRRLTAKITGTSPIMIPALLPEASDPLLQPYPKEPRFTETEDRGILSGQRVDETVYVAREGGQTQLSAISINWYNLKSGEIETAELDAVQLTLAAPKWKPPTPETLIYAVFLIGAFSVLSWGAVHLTRPRYQAWRNDRRARYLASYKFALNQLHVSLKNHDLSGSYTALEMCKTRGQKPKDLVDLEATLTQIGASRYAPEYHKTHADWTKARHAFKAIKTQRPGTLAMLPPLNP